MHVRIDKNEYKRDHGGQDYGDRKNMRKCCEFCISK